MKIFSKRKKDSRIILMTTKAKIKYNNFRFKRKDTLLFGRESQGVPREVHNDSYENLKNTIKKKFTVFKYRYGGCYNFI